VLRPDPNDAFDHMSTEVPPSVSVEVEMRGAVSTASSDATSSVTRTWVVTLTANGALVGVTEATDAAAAAVAGDYATSADAALAVSMLRRAFADGPATEGELRGDGHSGGRGDARESKQQQQQQQQQQQLEAPAAPAPPATLPPPPVQVPEKQKPQQQQQQPWSYFRRWAGRNEAAPIFSWSPAYHVLWSWLGSFLGIFLLCGFDFGIFQRFTDDLTSIVGSFGAQAVLLYATPGVALVSEDA
jgi:hypothetical protein